MQIAIILGAILIAAVGSLLGYAHYCANRKPRNNPREFLSTRPSDLNGRKTVVCVGDSITHGHVGCSYVDIVSRELDHKRYQLINAGINSELSYNVLRRLGEVIDCEPDFVTIMIGTNDANKSIDDINAKKAIRQMRLPQRPTAEWYRENLSEICRLLKTCTTAKIALLSLPIVTEDVNHPKYEHSLQFIEIIKEVADAHKVTYLPLRERMEAFLKENHSHTDYSFASRHGLARKAFLKHFYMNKQWNEIGAANGFNLLIDFVHLNCRGAEMVADLVSGFVLGKSGGAK